MLTTIFCEARHLHRVLVAELLGQRGDDLLRVLARRSAAARSRRSTTTVGAAAARPPRACRARPCRALLLALGFCSSSRLPWLFSSAMARRCLRGRDGISSPLLRDADLLALVVRLDADARALAGLRIDRHHLARVDRLLALEDAALRVARRRARVALDQVDALDDDLVVVGEDARDLALSCPCPCR